MSQHPPSCPKWEQQGPPEDETGVYERGIPRASGKDKEHCTRCVCVCVCVCVRVIHTLTCSSHMYLPPDVTLSSDFIAGFCGETEADHEETLSLMELVRFDAAYLFAYSMRKVRVQSSLPLIRSSKLTMSALTVPFPPPPTLWICRRHMPTIITRMMSLKKPSSDD